MRGKIVIAVMLGVALAAAGFAWWTNYQRAARIRQFWGPSASAIQSPTGITALLVDNDACQAVDTITLGDRKLTLACSEDLSQAPGMLNARTSLLVDESFDWTVSPADASPEGTWSHAVRFRNDASKVTLLFDFEGRQVAWVEAGQALRIKQKTAEGWHSYLDRALRNNERLSKDDNSLEKR